MHYVVVPEPVIARNINDKPYTEMLDGSQKSLPPITLHYFLLRYVINEVEVIGEGASSRTIPKMGLGYHGSKNIRKLDKLFEKVKPFDVVGVEDADWERVKKIIDEMNFNPPHFGAVLETISDAWMKATETKEDANKAALQLRTSSTEKKAEPESA